MKKTVNQFIQFRYKKKVFYYDKLNQKILNYEPNNKDKEINKKILKNSFLWLIYPGKILHPINIPIFIHIFSHFILFAFFVFSLAFFSYNFRMINFTFTYRWILEIIFIPFILFFSLLIHEFGHCLSGFTSGGFVAEVGVQKNFKIPFVTNTFFLEKNKRWIYYLGGPNINLFLLSLFLLLFSLYSIPFFFYIVVTNVIIYFTNIIPNKVYNNDGYKIFARGLNNYYDY